MAREILTLSFGFYSNFVASHFFNFQEAQFANENIDHDILHRRGIGVHGEETYLPRLLLFDLKGSFGSLSKENALYRALNAGETVSSWTGKTETYEAPKAPRNEFLEHLDEEDMESKKAPQAVSDNVFDLDNVVSYWSDYLGVYYHPKSFASINEYLHDSPEIPFDTFPQGTALHKSVGESIFEEQLRFFAEECDHLQGFHVFANASDGFGGLATSFIEEVRQEYSKTPVLLFACEHPQQLPITAELQERYWLNLGLGLNRFHASCNLVVPFKAPKTYLPLYKPNLPYHTSALLAAAADNATLSYRLRSSNINMSNLLNQLSSRSAARIGSLKFCCPVASAPTVWDLFATSTPRLQDPTSTLDLSAFIEKSNFSSNRPSTLFAESVVLRGIDPALPLHPSQTPTPQTHSSEQLQLFNATSSQDILKLALKQQQQCYYRDVLVDTQPWYLPLSFPKFLSQTSNQRVQSTSGFSRLQNNSDSLFLMRHVADTVRRVNILRHPAFHSVLESSDDLNELTNELYSIVDNFGEDD